MPSAFGSVRNVAAKTGMSTRSTLEGILRRGENPGFAPLRILRCPSRPLEASNGNKLAAVLFARTLHVSDQSHDCMPVPVRNDVFPLRLLLDQVCQACLGTCGRNLHGCPLTGCGI